ncbi:MAG TPA: NAD-dependent epimerase/dehydratase family protein [Gemmatimonadales bacterium]|nr:NAD-dependent epimerase/dehydratase family protein [Gemmatimonadales bacterium]
MTSARRRVAVTGASGFVGRATCERLASGWDVVAISRRDGAGTAKVRGLDDPEGLRAAFAGCEAVVHLAARVHVMRERSADPTAEFRQVNVAGTECVYRAAAAAGVRRFVFLSSVKVNGEGRATPYVESDAPAPVDPYGRSKLEAERRLAALRAEGGGCDVVVLRSPLVYGPGVGGNFRRLLHLAELSLRWPLPLGGIPNRRSLVAVGNLADAIGCALALPEAGGRTLLVSDGHDLSTSELIAALARGMGGSAHLAPCPQRLLRTLAALAGRRAEADRLLGSLTVDSSALRTQLGWTPPLTVEDALAATARWWRTREASA